MTNITKTEKKWYALYIRSKAEKKAYQLLNDAGFDVYLPLITRIKQWSDRKKKIEDPLFHSYLFVNTDIKDNKQYYDILNCFGVVKFITFEGKPVPVPDNQIVAIKNFLNEFDGEEVVSEELYEGELVRIKSGQMQGLVGRLISIRGKTRLIVHIEVVGQYLPINIARSKVEPFQVTKNQE